MDSQTSTEDLDCKPNVIPICLPRFFVNEFNECQLKDDCVETKVCANGEPSEFSEDFQGCFCKQDFDTEAYCDAECERASLKAYLTREGRIMLRVASDRLERTFDVADFGESLFIEGFTCQEDLCPILN